MVEPLLCAVNDAWIGLGVMDGDFHWHKHEDTDEFFLVMEGQLETSASTFITWPLLRRVLVPFFVWRAILPPRS